MKEVKGRIRKKKRKGNRSRSGSAEGSKKGEMDGEAEDRDRMPGIKKKGEEKWNTGVKEGLTDGR